MALKILHKNDVPRGGFEGIRENQLVIEPKVFGEFGSNRGAWSGLGNFVYLADANIIPKGESRLH
ncbi:MAG: pilus assembly protein, partial [Thermoproteota archaeon]|nr:pilus assembly protein [Thermoproteota archaeon]